METGIVYTTIGNGLNSRGQERSRAMVNDYHQKPLPVMRNKTAHRVDIAGLKKVEQRTAVTFNGQEYESVYTIGMEVEKNQLAARSVREYELFCGFERDGSCGYEAVTHILPLLPKGSWRTKVFDMMHKAEKIIDDRWSRSDGRNHSGLFNCGGHITIGVKGMSGYEIRDAIRKHCGIIYSIFRKRLRNTYCQFNNRMQDSYDCLSWHDKYQVALVKGDVLEFRLVSKFESVKQMMRRYELFYEVLNFAITNPNGTHAQLMKVIKPIILSMYEGNVEKTEMVIELSKHFQAYINSGDVHVDIRDFIR